MQSFCYMRLMLILPFLFLFREYYWANYATGLGASLHELGHTFDLAHTPTGIMARGFDDLHKVKLNGLLLTARERERERERDRQTDRVCK